MVKGSRFDPTTLIFVALLLTATVLAVWVSVPLWVFAAIIGAAFLTIAISAIRNPVLFKIGVRSIIRRRGMSLIVIAGLMIGTVIISSSLVIGDTMDRMITRVHYDMYHEVDEIIYADGLEDEKLLFRESEVADMMEDMRDLENVEGVTAYLDTTVFVMDETSGQTEPGIRLVGYNTSSLEFGTYEKIGKELPMDLPPDEVYIDSKTAGKLDASKGDQLMIPTDSGNIKFTIAEIVDHEGRAYWMGDCLFMPLDNAREALGLQGMVNMILVTNDGGVRGGEEHCSQVVNDLEVILDGSELEVKRDKHTEVERGKDEMKQFSQMFLVFGSFSIIAGIILIVNIFVMLGEERKGEMGISRAVGMSRGDLKRTFVFEGSMYSAASSLVGAGLGVGVAYIVLWGMNNVFSKWFDDTSIIESFNFQQVSLVHAFTFGMLISLVTVSFAASRINKLNIVRAIRNIPEPRISRNSNKVLFIGSFLILFGLGLFGSGLVLFKDMGLENYEAAGIYAGISLSLIGGALVARRIVGDRIAYSVMSVILIIFWMIPAKILGLDQYGGDMEMFVLSGVFAVSAGIILFIFNSNQIMSALTNIWSMTGRPTATMKTASSYPMKNRFRTGMTIYMFALIVFTITVMSMIVGVLSVNIERITQEQMGEIEILGISSSHYVIEDVNLAIEESNSLSHDDFDRIYSLPTGNVILDNGKAHPIEDGNQTMQSLLIGIGPDFRETGWMFKERMEGLESDEEVWEALQNDGSLAVVDATLAFTDEEWGPEYLGFAVEVGERIWVKTPNGREEKTIAGIMEQELVAGVFVSSTSAKEQFNITGADFYLFDIADGVDDDEIAKNIERELGLQTVVLSTIVEQITSSMEQMFNLFSAFMGLGLVVGIAGLGIITLRAVHERRVEIGMMRAIGFQRHSVTWSFLMEAGFIATTGILLGSLLGMALGYTLWYDEFKPMNFEFYIPWLKIVFVGAVSLVATLVFTVFPSFSASTVAPAEALRYD